MGILAFASGEVPDPLNLGISVGGTLIVTVPVGLMYLFGGVSFVRKQSLSSAKTVSVLACIPCFNCVLLLMPFGIWGCVVAFSDQGRRDFTS